MPAHADPFEEAETARIAEQHDDAIRLYSRACDEGNQRGCVLLGWYLRVGEHIEQDLTRSLQLFRQACDANVPLGCSHLGDAYYFAFGVEQNSVRALWLYRTAYDEGNGPLNPCQNAGSIYIEAPSGVDRDLELGRLLPD